MISRTQVFTLGGAFMKVLIADDELAFRNMLEEILARWGYEVVATRDGAEAWHTLRAENAPQLAILDWMMPEMDGLEVCRRVRQEVREPYIYLILLTARGQDEDLVRGMESGADDFLAKPLKTDELKVRLNAGQRIVELQNELVAAREALVARASDLEEANRDLEDFSYTVSNDLLKSLLSIGENAKSLQDMYCSKQDEMCRSYTRRIYEKTKNLGQLIGIMHEFFQPTRVALHRGPLDLSKMAGQIAEKLRMRQSERRVVFRIAEGVSADGDRDLMEVVLDNLFTNAWQHTAKREEAVIDFGTTDSGGKRAFFVRDNGTGFNMAHAVKLFAPFRNLPDAEESARPRVGLATVARAIRRHGGRVWAEGEPGVGATFYFTLG
jgi:DNA-binding response OmpR family regulator